MKGGRSFRLFYCDFGHDVSISSANPEPLAADRLVPLAEQLLAGEDNYLGVVDANETILQFYLSGKKLVVELIYPNSSGILQLKLPVDEGLELLGSLPDEFTEELLPGATYIG